MPLHMMYLTVISAVLAVSWMAALTQPPQPKLAAEQYCADGIRVYAPGRVEDGRLHHIDIEQLTGCEEER